MLAAPLVLGLANKDGYKKIITTAFVLIMLTGIVRIYYYHIPITNRLNWQRTFLAKHEGKKLIVHERHAPMDTLMMSWGSAYEFWLLSTIETGETASIAISNNIDSLITPPGKIKSFITEYGGYPYAMLPERYFKFTDTVSTYEVIE